MEKEEFIRKMHRVIQAVRSNNDIHSCVVMTNLFSPNDRKICMKYKDSIRHLIIEDMYVDWEALGVKYGDFKKMREYRVIWLLGFRDRCLKDEFYKEL